MNRRVPGIVLAVCTLIGGIAVADALTYRDPDPGTMTVEEVDAELAADWARCTGEEEQSRGTSYPQDASSCMDTAVWAMAETCRHFRVGLLDESGAPVREPLFSAHLEERAAIVSGGAA
jgi:hypothetical protein